MAEETTRLAIPSPDARSARTPFGGKVDPFGVGGAPSTNILTITINILNTETVTIGGKVYTFQDTLTDVDGNVHIGATAEDTLDNLVAAINLSNEGESAIGAGTDYAAAMTLHPTVSAVDGAALTLECTAKFNGTAGDALNSLEGIVSAGAVWSEGATFANGVDPDAAVQFVPIVQWSQIRARVRLDGADGSLTLQFARPARNPVVATGIAEVYTVDQPAAVGPTALADGVEQSLEITAAEHVGENWLKVSVTAESSLATIGGPNQDGFLDISGELLGTFH